MDTDDGRARHTAVVGRCPASERILAQLESAAAAYGAQTAREVMAAGRALAELADNRLADYVKMRSERDRLLAVPVAQDCVSDPREPTFAMSQAGTNIPIRIGRTEYFPLDAEVCAIYRAMCAASKEPK